MAPFRTVCHQVHRRPVPTEPYQGERERMPPDLGGEPQAQAGREYPRTDSPHRCCNLGPDPPTAPFGPHARGGRPPARSSLLAVATRFQDLLRTGVLSERASNSRPTFCHTTWHAQPHYNPTPAASVPHIPLSNPPPGITIYYYY